ncbi:MAG: diaminopimelate epimerase [Ignavibacterium sp.]|jgi:diaminopimelate epimerase
MKLEFTKMSGAGNDFVVLDNRAESIRDKPGLAKRLCDRHWGVGADGLLLVEKSSRGADYRMEYYNADGSYGGMCGNGGRCIAVYAVHRGIASPNHRFDALDHMYEAKVKGAEVVLKMKDPKDLRLNFVLRLAGGDISAHYVDTGAPHVVVEVPGELNDVDVVGLGRSIREHSNFKPGGTNVNFLKILGDKSLQIRTYERGVEAETLACGTGSIASAIIAGSLGKAKPPVGVMVRSGSTLKVDFDAEGDGKIRNVRLSGPAVTVFEGTIEFREN